MKKTNSINKLSVIIPMYNAELYIEECIKSIIKQADPVEKIIIVDDGSTDDSVAKCNKLIQFDKRLELISQCNKGVAAARYAGLKKCKTEYAVFVDADDFILDNAYISAIEPMSSGIDMIVYEIARYYNEETIERERHIIQSGYYDKKRIEEEVYPKLIWDFDRRSPGIECQLGVRIAKTSLLLRMYEGININFHYGEDVAIVWPLFKAISSLFVVNECFYMHRQRVNEVLPYIKSNDFYEQTFNMYRCLSEAFRHDLAIFGKQIDYYYMYSVERRKSIYNDYNWSPDYLFPFNRVSNKKRVVLYGAGSVGRAYYSQLIELNYCSDLLWVDKKFQGLNIPNVKNPEMLKTFDYEIVVIAIANKQLCKQVKIWLINEMKVKDSDIVF